MNNELKILETPFNIGKETIKNRYCVSPMSIPQLHNAYGGWSDEGIAYFEERAKGGFGLIMTGALPTDMTVDRYDPKSSANPNYAPGNFLRTSSKLVERVSAYGAKIFAEITMGTGRNYPTMHAPSAVECYNYPMMKGVELTVEEIHQKRDQLIQAAAICKKAGYHGVDVHALHWGYLLDEFLMTITNKRTDEYGGSFENRMRIVTEIVGGIKKVCGADYPITIGLSCKSFIKALNTPSLHGEDEAGRTLEEAIEIAKALEKLGVAAIPVDLGIYDSFYYACPPCYMPQGHGIEYYKKIKEAVNIPVIARSRMNDPFMCAKAINEGKVDAIMLGRQSLADPFLPRKVETGKESTIRPCIGCNMGCIGPLLEQGKNVGCAVNPRALNEYATKSKKSIAPRKIAVVGGGVGGMQAALTAADCGHTVEIFEKSPVLGGELNAAGAHSFKNEIHQLRDWYIAELKERNVPIHLETELCPDCAKKAGFDTVILATGAAPVMPASIPGVSKAISAVEHLEGKKPVGDSVIVVGGGMVGCETAVDLANHGKKVTLVEALPKILSAEFVPQQHKMMLKDLLADRGVTVLEGHKLSEVTDTGAIVEPTAGGEREALTADTVVLSIGMRPNTSLWSEFIGNDFDLYEIGSAKKAGNIITSVHEAFEVVYNFE